MPAGKETWVFLGLMAETKKNWRLLIDLSLANEWWESAPFPQPCLSATIVLKHVNPSWPIIGKRKFLKKCTNKLKKVKLPDEILLAERFFFCLHSLTRVWRRWFLEKFYSHSENDLWRATCSLSVDFCRCCATRYNW